MAPGSDVTRPVHVAADGAAGPAERQEPAKPPVEMTISTEVCCHDNGGGRNDQAFYNVIGAHLRSCDDCPEEVVACPGCGGLFR